MIPGWPRKKENRADQAESALPTVCEFGRGFQIFQAGFDEALLAVQPRFSCIGRDDEQGGIGVKGLEGLEVALLPRFHFPFALDGDGRSPLPCEHEIEFVSLLALQ